MLIASLGCWGCRSTGPWHELFEGDWHTTPFGGQGVQSYAEGTLILEPGEPLTGITWSSPLPPRNYEIELLAARLAGSDFFLGLTFPVEEEFLTLILGGWGGALCGLSCLDGEDAAHNETKFFMGFEEGRDYRVRLKVDAGEVRVWIEGERVIDVETRGRELSLRPEVEASAPLGVATFQTRGRIQGLRWRELR